ncbi:lytic transglycosylase domain-containing protein [Paeniglutamicibacter sp.]|uniref:lytic transglycosylase domain-containing protein n=1 Tax=Paeniglutamicibacter sp. TaxID=1934391 RepID=UPI003988C6AC
MKETVPRHDPRSSSAGPRRKIAAIFVVVILLLGLVAVIERNARGILQGAPVGELASGEIPNGWASLIEAAAEESGVPAPILAAQIEAESDWQVDALSPAGAQGPTQFMPATWEEYGQGGDPQNPVHAIDAQGRFMGDLLALAESSGIEGDPIDLALAGYNAGFGAVQRYDGIPPYPETENYVEKIRRLAPAYEDATRGQNAEGNPGFSSPGAVAVAEGPGPWPAAS